MKHKYIIVLFSCLFLTSLNACIPTSLEGGLRIVTNRALRHRRQKVIKAQDNASQVKVKKGDTVYSIARKHNVPVRTLIEINKLSAPYILRVGQILKLPHAPFHIVQKGDTLFGISRRYGVELSSLARANKLVSPYNIYANQKLILPGSIKTSPSAPPQRVAKPTTEKRTSTTKPKAKPTPPKRTNIPTPTARSSERFAWPVKGKIISNFGQIGKGINNDGINIAAKKGSKVLSAENGVIVYTGNELKGFGNLVLIKHADNYMTAYAHNDSILAKKGQNVKKGEAIATVGSTGSVVSPQLHFEIRKGRKPVNPILYLEKQ